ncbi:MAG: DNA primase [Dehalococcoidales bacterium]
MSAIEEVKQKTDIVEIISQYTSLSKSGRTLRGLCPFHSEKTPSFFVYPDQQSWHCFGACGTGGDVFSFLMKKEGIGFGEALRLLGERAGINIAPRFENKEKKEDRERIYQINGIAANYYHDMLLSSSAAKRARDYVKGRGLLEDIIARFKLGYSPNSWDALGGYLRERGYSKDELLSSGLIVARETGESYDRFRNRMIFPICDSRGYVVGFGARALDDSSPKYINSPQTRLFDKSSSLYGIDVAATGIREHDQAVIVEGYMDAITAHQGGYGNVVASMGTAVTEKQINILKRLTRNVILALDADVAGEEAMLRSIVYQNILGSEIRVVVLPEGKDPDSVIRENPQFWQDLLAKAVPIMDYAFDMVTDGLDLSSARGKSLAVERLLPVIAGMKDYAYMDHYLDKLGKLTGISKSKLEGIMGRVKAPDGDFKNKKPERFSDSRASRAIYSDPREEYCLALLLHNPFLKRHSQMPLPEYFGNTENREIFNRWQECDDILSLKEKVDASIHEHLEAVLNGIDMELMDNGVECKYTDCVLQLRKKYLRSLESKRAAALALEAEMGGSSAVIARLKEEGTEVSTQLREAFTRKSRGSGSGI